MNNPNYSIKRVLFLTDDKYQFNLSSEKNYIIDLYGYDNENTSPIPNTDNTALILIDLSSSFSGGYQHLKKLFPDLNSTNIPIIGIIEKGFGSSLENLFKAKGITSIIEKEENKDTFTSFLKSYIDLYFNVLEKQPNKELINNTNHRDHTQGILGSIEYAQNIQQGILPEIDEIRSLFPKSFIYFQPKDVVSGDFYWFTVKNGKAIFAVGDCTGHGVPGAMMSLIGNNLLNAAVNWHGLESTADILQFVHRGLLELFSINNNSSTHHDSIDMSICSYDFIKKELEFSGALRPLFLFKNGILTVIKGDSVTLGRGTSYIQQFNSHKISISKSDVVYLFSDGYADQFGGKKNKKFSIKKFREFLISIQDYPLSDQPEIIDEAFRLWKGDHIQTDDVLILGLNFSNGN